MTRLVTKCLDRIAWEIWLRLPWTWQHDYGANGPTLRMRLWNVLARRCNDALNNRRLVP